MRFASLFISSSIARLKNLTPERELTDDAATLSGSWIDISIEPASFGIAVDLGVTPYRFRLSCGRGTLTPGIFARAYRGVLPQLRDEVGSEAPLSSIAVGLDLRYDFPE
jgi:hypothetical protein